MGLFTNKWGPTITEPPFFQRLRELADETAEKVTGQAQDYLEDLTGLDENTP